MNIVQFVLSTFFVCVFMFGVAAAAVDRSELQREIAEIAKHSKMASKQTVENAVFDDEQTVRVIVQLKQNAGLISLSAQSVRAKSLKNSGWNNDSNQAPTLKQSRSYDLQNKRVRNELKSTIKQQVDSITLDAKSANRLLKSQSHPAIKFSKRFNYLSSIAAQVTPEGLQWLLANDQVESVSYDLKVKLHGAQGIPLINASNSRSEYSGIGVSIAIVDDGIASTHISFGGTSGQPNPVNAKVIGGYDFADDDADFTPLGNHGTTVAGIAAGVEMVSGDYIGGVAPESKLYSLKVVHDNPADNNVTAYLSDVLDAWDWAVTNKDADPDNPILVVNTSLGVEDVQYSSVCDADFPALAVAAENLWSEGISHFASSGNDGFCSAIAFPSCLSKVNAVGAIYDADIGDDQSFPVSEDSCVAEDTFVGFLATDATTEANQVTAYSNVGDDLMLFAPAENTTAPIGTTNGFDAVYGGTSSASAYAAGAAAVLQNAAKVKLGRFLTPQEVRDILVENGTDITDVRDAAAPVTKPKINLDESISALDDLASLCWPIKAMNGNVAVVCL